MRSNLHEIYALELLSGGDTFIHRLHPAVKLITATVFIVAVVSFGRYDFGGLIPYVFYPALLMSLSETPWSMLHKRFLLALPFCLFAGISNVILDRAAAFEVFGVSISYGLISLLTILLRAYLCVMAVLILVSTTPFSQLAKEARRARAPDIFVTLFEMTYRYIGVLLDEAYSMYTAYRLRSAGASGIRIRDMGSFTGQLLLRGFDRAERVYSAMKCRGYPLREKPGEIRRLDRRDVTYLAVVCIFCAVFRLVDANTLFVKMAGGLV